MVKKRSVFDIDFDPAAEPEPFPAGNPAAATVPLAVPAPGERQGERQGERRGPMASAITEAAQATHDRARAEAAIRAENDALAHEHVRLKKLGLITDLIPVEAVLTTKLTRDRSAARDPDLEELKTSIREVGLSNPIRVEQAGQGFELIQGWRRLNAFRELLTETGDARYSRIPAALVPRGEPLADLYRKMVDENLVRRDISFGEMAGLAIAYAQDAGIGVDAAVGVLYASALKQKRTYIRSFARLIDRLGGALRHPEAIPRALGLDLARLTEGAEAPLAELRRRLEAAPGRDAEAELAILRAVLVAAPAKTAKPKSQSTSTARTSLRIARPEGEARMTAADGKVELRMSRDFASVSRDRLQAAAEAFFAALDEPR